MPGEPNGAPRRSSQQRLGRPLLIAVAAVIAGWLFAACTSPETPETSEGRGSPSPQATASPDASAVATPRAPSRPPVPRLGAWIVDVASGEVTKLHELAARPEPSLPPPSITASGAVWLTKGDGVAGRYEPSLGLGETIEDAVVWESSDSATRAVLSDGGMLSLERDGERTVVGEAARSPTLSPDGRSVAYLERRGDADFDLLVASVEDPPRVLATGVQLCDCDEPAGPSWSPSGSFIAFGDFGPSGAGEPADRGGYAVRVDDTEPPVRVTDRPDGLLGWLAAAEHTLVLQVISEPRLFDAASGEIRALLRPGLLARGTGRLTHDARHVQIWTPDGGTTLTDPSAGEELERWSLRGDATLTPFGPSLTVNGPNVALVSVVGCWGVWLEHPNLPEGECVRGAERAQWSPDGSTLALLSAVGSFDRWLEFWTFDDQMVRVLVPRWVTGVEWSAGGGHVLVTWGYDG